MSEAGADNAALLAAVTALRAEVAASSLPLDLPQTQAAAAHRRALLHQLDDYVIPRLSSLDAPLLAVIGGSTGAGKSTLVNSLVDADVSRSGVLRPTTTSPVLVHHPEDSAAFTGDRILPGLNRVTGAGSADGDDGQGTVRLVASRSLPPGMAVLDAPDIDSVVSGQPRPGRAASRPPTCGSSSPPPPGTRTPCLGAAAPGLRAGDRRRHRARPRPARGDDRDPRAPRLHAARAGPLDRPHLRHPETTLTKAGRLPGRTSRGSSPG